MILHPGQAPTEFFDFIGSNEKGNWYLDSSGKMAVYIDGPSTEWMRDRLLDKFGADSGIRITLDDGCNRMVVYFVEDYPHDHENDPYLRPEDEMTDEEFIAAAVAHDFAASPAAFKKAAEEYEDD
jgi:hypothetical protein